MDIDSLPPFLQTALGYGQQGWDVAKVWLLSPAAWSQFALLIAGYLLAVVIYRFLSLRLKTLLTPAQDSVTLLASARNFALMFLPLLLPVLAYGFAGIGEQITKAVFESSAVIAFGKRVFLLLAARIFVQKILTDSFLKLLGKYVLLPVMVLYTFGLLDVVMAQLIATKISVGNISFSVMAIVRGLIAGSLLFWLGQWSNGHSTNYIGKQEEMRPSIRQLASKTIEFSIFGICFLLLMNIMGINLSALAVLGGAIGVGLGFGLQKIASNFISGVILLLEGQATVGDFVELDGGEAGTIVKMTARATFLETFDGRWIVVPNEDFITTRVINYSDQGSSNRYEANFSVSYDTDINKVPTIIEAAVAKHPDVLDSPEGPDCELRGFGDSGIDFCLEFWVNGKNKYTSQVLFLIWNALKDNDIEIPYPHRVIEIKGGLPK